MLQTTTMSFIGKASLFLASDLFQPETCTAATTENSHQPWNASIFKNSIMVQREWLRRILNEMALFIYSVSCGSVVSSTIAH